MKINFNFTVIALFFLVSLFLVVRWLPNKVIMAGGDVGIPVLNPQKVLEVQSYAWWDTHATGITSPTTYTALPLYLILAALEKIGLTAELNQKLLFFSLLFGGSLSIYFLALTFHFNKWTAFFSALFYISNLTSLSVWQRGVHNGMLMLLLAPLSLLILVKGISGRKYISILWINVASFLLSYVFGSVGYVFSLWLLWTMYLLLTLGREWADKTKRNFIFTYFFLLVISWVGTNAWWIVHLLSSSNYALGQFTPEELKARGSDVLEGLKPYHQPQYILRGLSAYYHYIVKDWGDSYFNPFVTLLSWIPTVVVFSTTLVKTNYKLTYWRFLITLTAIVLIISKGVNPPLGFLNKIPYDLFLFLAPLRNPYEKVGILLAIPFSLLFAQGLYQIISFLKSRKMHYLSLLGILIGILCLTVLVWPLWLGKLFVSEGRKYTVSIPSYYKEANNWLKERVLAEDTRILHLPLSWGESIDYDWGYTGIEPSQYFFNGSSIGYQIGVSSVDTRIRDLLLLIHKQDTVNIQKAIASLNIGWIVIHNETTYRSRILESPERINKWLATEPYFLEYITDFGPLSVWRVKDQYRLGHFYTVGKLINLSNIKSQASLNMWSKFSAIDDSFLTEVQDNYRSSIKKYISENIVLPTKSIIYSPLGTLDKDISFKDLAEVNYLPDSLIHPLMILKENVFALLTQGDPVINCFILSGKRLKEAALLSRQNKFTVTNKSLISYQKQLDKCTKINNGTVIAYMGGNQRDLTLGQLIKQRVVLDNEFNNTYVAKEARAASIKLIEYLADLGFAPMYSPVKLNNDKQRIIFSYSVSEEGDYSLKFNKPEKDLIKVPPKITQIDGQLVDLAPVEVSTTDIRYPLYKFSKGFHEVQLETEFNRNLFDPQIQTKKSTPDFGFTVEADQATKRPIFIGKTAFGLINLTFDLPNIEVEQNYKLYFDTFLDQGMPPFVTITNDSDSLDSSGNQIPAVKGQVLSAAYYPADWKRIEVNYSPVLNSTSAKLSIILISGNTSPTEAKFKNIGFEKIFNYDLVLEEGNIGYSRKLGSLALKWNKINPTLYNLDLNNQSEPYILVFSETFHPLWQITDMAGNKIDTPHFSINGSANGWLIEKPIPAKLKVEFVLQKTFAQGILTAIVSFIITSMLSVYLDFRKKIE